MAVIHTIEDLVKILDERPEWHEALRTRMLTRELLELPQVVAQFAAGTEHRLTARPWPSLWPAQTSVLPPWK